MGSENFKEIFKEKQIGEVVGTGTSAVPDTTVECNEVRVIQCTQGIYLSRDACLEEEVEMKDAVDMVVQVNAQPQIEDIFKTVVSNNDAKLNEVEEKNPLRIKLSLNKNNGKECDPELKKRRSGRDILFSNEVLKVNNVDKCCNTISCSSNNMSPDLLISKFYKLGENDLDTLKVKKCVNCGSLDVHSKGKSRSGECRAKCGNCNKDFPLRFALLMAEICNVSAGNNNVNEITMNNNAAKSAVTPSNTQKINIPKVVRVAEQVAKLNDKNSSVKNNVFKSLSNDNNVNENTKIQTKIPAVKVPLTSEEVDNLLKPVVHERKYGNKTNVTPRKAASRLNFMYVKNLKRSSPTLIKKALEAKIDELSSGDIVNVSFVGYLVELVVYEKVSVVLKEKLNALGLQCVDWNPVYDENGKDIFRKRMTTISERPYVKTGLKYLAQNLAKADDEHLSVLLNGCGVNADNTAAKRGNITTKNKNAPSETSVAKKH